MVKIEAFFRTGRRSHLGYMVERGSINLNKYFYIVS